MLGAVEDLAAEGFEVNTHGCRQMTEGLEVLAARARAHSLPTTVVVALGANWTVTSDQIRHALMILGRERVLGLVTPRELGGAVTSDQANMRAAGRRWPRRVKVLDWQALAHRQARRLRPDVTVVFLGANDGFPMAGAA